MNSQSNETSFGIAFLKLKLKKTICHLFD